MPILLLTLNESATRLAVSQRTVRRLIDRGELPYVKVRGAIRISSQSLETYVEQNTYFADNGVYAGPVVRKGGSTCHTSVKKANSGGHPLSHQMAKELDDLLELKATGKPALSRVNGAVKLI